MKKMITFLLLAAISISASADKDIYQDQLLFHCFDDGTAEVRRSDYHDTREMDIVNVLPRSLLLLENPASKMP